MGLMLRRVCDWAEALFRWAGVVPFTVMIAAVFFEIVMRYVFDAPMFWAEPPARNAMIWMAPLGLAVGVRHRENICVDFIADRISGPLGGDLVFPHRAAQPFGKGSADVHSLGISAGCDRTA